MSKPIRINGKTFFPEKNDKFFEDLKPGDFFKTKRSPTIYQSIAGEAAIVYSETETIPKQFNPKHPVQTLKAF